MSSWRGPEWRWTLTAWPVRGFPQPRSSGELQVELHSEPEDFRRSGVSPLDQRRWSSSVRAVTSRKGSSAPEMAPGCIPYTRRDRSGHAEDDCSGCAAFSE